MAEESKGDLTGRLWLSQPLVADRLRVFKIAWNSAFNPWSSSLEGTVFQLSESHEPSAIPLGGFFDLQTQAETMRNESILVALQPKDNVFSRFAPSFQPKRGIRLGYLLEPFGTLLTIAPSTVYLVPKKIFGWITAW